MNVRRFVFEHGWWLAATAVVTVTVTLVTGMWLLPLYAFANAVGTLFYLDGLRGRPARMRRMVLPWLTAALVPVGILATLGWRRTDPIDATLGHEGVRNHTAASNVYGERRHMGSG